MYEKEIGLDDARRVDQRHRRQAEHAELAEGRSESPKFTHECHSRAWSQYDGPGAARGPASTASSSLVSGAALRVASPSAATVFERRSAFAASRAAAPVGAAPPSAAALLRQASSEASRASTAAEASRASLFTQLGVFGASDCGVARVFKPSPTLTDDSMTAPYRYTSCFNFKSLDLEF